jgi:hypothetical protein
MKRLHPESCMTNGKTDITSSFEMLPDDVMYHIFSFLSSPQTIKGVSDLHQTIGIVSKILRKRVKGFVQTTFIECKIDWEKKPYRLIAWLCDNHIRIGTLEIMLNSHYLNACITKYMIEQCDLTDLGVVNLTCVRFDDEPPNYEPGFATESGIPEEVVDSIMGQVAHGEYDTNDVQKACLQAICDRAKKCFDLSVIGTFFVAVGCPCDVGFVTSQFVKLPLQKLHLELLQDFDPCPPQHEFTLLSEAIEAFRNLQSLKLHIPGGCPIRSKSLRKLDYVGWNELIQCECPLLETMVLCLWDSIETQLLTFFSHSIKNLCIFCNFHQRSEEDTVRLTEIIRAMPLLEELRVEDEFDDILYLGIESESLRRITLKSWNPTLHLSYCKCPKLEMLYWKAFDPGDTFPLVPVDDEVFQRLMNTWDEDTGETVFMFRDCPFRRCEVPDSCLIKHYILALEED